jgi:hypothetical protein
MTDSELLAYSHVQVGIDECTSCHELTTMEEVHSDVMPTQTFVKTRKYPQEFCLGCHGTYADLIALTADSTVFEATDGRYFNPHEPPTEEHDENVDCYKCHKVHTTFDPITYCYGCHHAGELSSCNTCHDH